MVVPGFPWRAASHRRVALARAGVIFVALVIPLAAGCGRNVEPLEAQRVISGGVVLKGDRRDNSGDVVGELRVDDASGVPVRMLREQRLLQSESTRSGRYSFFADEQPAVVAVGLLGIENDTVPVPAGSEDLELPQAEVEGAGSMRAWPNPYCNCDGRNPRLAVSWSNVLPASVCLELRSTAGVPLRQLASGEQTASTGSVTLRGALLDDDGQPLPAGNYWITLDRTGPCGATQPGVTPAGGLPAYEAELVRWEPQ